MADPKGDKLFVNIGPSQARKRLKGFGHGVRKIQSAGRNQAVIIHTAIGRHLDQLKAQFADVGCSTLADELQEPIDNLPNLGPTSAGWLREAGLFTISDLRQLGAVPAYRRVKQAQPQATLNLLWALAAGLVGKDWRTLNEEEKSRFRDELTN
jgi:predicted DNA-binding protein